MKAKDIQVVIDAAPGGVVRVTIGRNFPCDYVVTGAHVEGRLLVGRDVREYVGDVSVGLSRFNENLSSIVRVGQVSEAEMARASAAIVAQSVKDAAAASASATRGKMRKAGGNILTLARCLTSQDVPTEARALWPALRAELDALLGEAQ